MDILNPILVLAPHTDDGEIGCGASIAKFIEDGHEVFYVAFSSARRSVPKGFPDNILETEVRKATKILGIPPKNLILFDYEVRTFPADRQNILENMIQLKKDLNPGLVLCPSQEDIHQDHQTIYQEALRAFKCHSILAYEQPWNNIVFRTRCFIRITKEHLQKKLEALGCYESQKHRGYLTEDAVTGLARTRGAQIEGDLAEAFEVIRWML